MWNNTGDSLVITISPPFWKTTWAYLFYFILISASVFFTFHFYARKIKRENIQRQKIYESEKEKEIYNTKIDFFTNIAHEIRTPLTLIKGPLESVIKKEVKEDELEDNLLIMEKNTDRLLSLINQLLDFRKTEAKGFNLMFSTVNVNNLLEETYIRFKPLAKQKGLDFRLSLPEILYADVDKEAVIKILSNLFTNAIKHARTTINVELINRGDNRFDINIKNDGILVDPELKKKIFEPFYQIKEGNNEVKSGSGIGLALVKSLVDLHEGNVFLEIDNGMNNFVVSLPVKQKNVFLPESEMSDATATKIADAPEIINKFLDKKKNDTRSILLVEDNEELIEFISKKIETQYIVFKATNGIEAIKILEKEMINLIVSDIMMPYMDGFELCSKVKQSTEFSHIPVILLTAKTNVQSKIEGLECGADAYIEKPFSMEHLQAQISNLFENREKIRSAFANFPLTRTGSIALTKSDEQFLNKLTDIIHKNISDTEFGVDQLADELFMSRSSLLRKIKGVSGMTPNDFIRLVRLKRAAEILKEDECKVNEVCYLVGFSSTSSYFSKAFQKQFGILPKDFAKSFKKKEN